MQTQTPAPTPTRAEILQKQQHERDRLQSASSFWNNMAYGCAGSAAILGVMSDAPAAKLGAVLLAGTAAICYGLHAWRDSQHSQAQQNLGSITPAALVQVGAPAAQDEKLASDKSRPSYLWRSLMVGASFVAAYNFIQMGLVLPFLAVTGVGVGLGSGIAFQLLEERISAAKQAREALPVQEQFEKLSARESQAIKGSILGSAGSIFCFIAAVVDSSLFGAASPFRLPIACIGTLSGVYIAYNIMRWGLVRHDIASLKRRTGFNPATPQA